jgi:hypothetical protein
MAQLFRIALLFLGLVCCITNGFGQAPAEKPISGDFMSQRFDQFVRTIEANTPYHFSTIVPMSIAWVVDLRVDKQPLRAVLRQLFEGSKFSFSIDNLQRVYVTVNRPIRTELPIGFFLRGSSDSETDSTSASYLTESQKKRVETRNEAL